MTDIDDVLRENAAMRLNVSLMGEGCDIPTDLDSMMDIVFAGGRGGGVPRAPEEFLAAMQAAVTSAYRSSRTASYLVIDETHVWPRRTEELEEPWR